jgi:hypothetical protein
MNMDRRFAVLLLLVALASPASAGLSDADRARLADQINSATTQLDAGRLPQFEQAKTEVLQRIETATDFFRRKTSPENNAAWLEYLDLDPLRTSLQADQADPAVGREAVELHDRLVGIAPGLELTVLRNLRDSLNRLIASLRFRDGDKSIETLARQLGSLAERIGQLDKNPSSDDAAAISAMVEILASAGQATDLITELRNTFGRPNAAILIGEPMVQTVIAQNVNQSRPVNDCILGTRVIGTATLRGTVSANLLPSLGAARIQVSLNGDVVSNNTGYNGPVRLFTTGHGTVHASRTITVNESGLQLEPVSVIAQMQTQINHIEPNRHLGKRLVRRIATKRAAEQKPQADQIANHKFRTQVGQQFAEQTADQGALEIPDFMRDVRPVLQRLSLVEPLRIWGSTDSDMFIDATVRRHDQISTVVTRPRVSGPFAAVVQIHESAINNAAAPVLAGRTINERRLGELMEAAGRQLPTAGESDDEEQAPFEITFSRLRPIIFEAREQTIRLGVRGTRFAQGSREIRQPMEITAVYRAEQEIGGPVLLRRVGDVEVSFPGNRRLTVSQAGMKSTIQKKFSGVFPVLLLDQPLIVPQTAQLAAIRGKVFQPRLVDARDGWLTVGVQ